MNEDKASRYHRLSRRAQVLAVTWSAAVLVALVASPLSGIMRDVAVELTLAASALLSLTPSLIVVFYVVMLAAVHECGALPIAYYRGHVIESRYGLSTQSAARWWGTYIKGAAVGLGFLLAGAVLLYALIRWWPDGWWFAAGVAWLLAMICLARLGPVLLLPLFYELEPIQRDELQRDLIRLARKAGTTAVGVYRWRLSDSTRKANAALVGLGRTRRILLSDTLLTEYSDDEIGVVLAHELAHHAHGDIWRGMAFEAAVQSVGFFMAQRVLTEVGPRAGVTDVADVAGLPIVLLVCGALSLMVRPLAHARSRAQERRADRVAIDLTRNQPAFISAMRRLAQQNLAEERPSRLVQALFHSHPSTAERLAIAGSVTSPANRGQAAIIPHADPHGSVSTARGSSRIS
jgi:STE24 endopeptidase